MHLLVVASIKKSSNADKGLKFKPIVLNNMFHSLGNINSNSLGTRIEILKYLKYIEDHKRIGVFLSDQENDINVHHGSLKKLTNYFHGGQYPTL